MITMKTRLGSPVEVIGYSLAGLFFVGLTMGMLYWVNF